jgi:hypothetical protein
LRNRYQRHANRRGTALPHGKAVPVGELQKGLHLCEGLPVKGSAISLAFGTFLRPVKLPRPDGEGCIVLMRQNLPEVYAW